VKYNNFVAFLLCSVVMSCPCSFLGHATGRTAGPIFMLYDSNEFSRKKLPFSGLERWMTLFGEICPQNPVKVGVNRQCQAKTHLQIVLSLKLQVRSISRNLRTNRDHQSHFVGGLQLPRPNPT